MNIVYKTWTGFIRIEHRFFQILWILPNPSYIIYPFKIRMYYSNTHFISPNSSNPSLSFGKSHCARSRKKACIRNHTTTRHPLSSHLYPISRLSIHSRVNKSQIHLWRGRPSRLDSTWLVSSFVHQASAFRRLADRRSVEQWAWLGRSGNDSFLIIGGMNDGRMISPQKPSNPFRHGISHSRELCSLLLVAANQPSPAVQSSMNHPVSVSSCIYYPTLVTRLICRLSRSHLSSTCTRIEW